jgi:Tol biopolymer transport system component
MRTRFLQSLASLGFLVLSNCGKSSTGPEDPIGDAVLVMASNWTGQFDVWLRDSADRLTDLTPSQPNLDQSPRWTPDGQHIVFESGREPLVATMYIMNPPDGQQITFQGHDDIWIANANGTQAMRLILGAGKTPDGGLIVFAMGTFISGDSQLSP